MPQTKRIGTAVLSTAVSQRSLLARRSGMYLIRRWEFFEPPRRLPVLVQFTRSRLMLLREDLRQGVAELGLGQDPRDHKTEDRLLQQLLDPAGAVEAAVDCGT